MTEESIVYEASDSDNLTLVKATLRECVGRLQAEREIVDGPSELKRRLSLCITQLETAIMWITAAQCYDCDV